MQKLIAGQRVTFDADRRTLLKRLPAATLALGFTLALAGCGGKPTDWRPEHVNRPRNRHRHHHGR